MKRFWIFQDSKYTRLLHMQALHKVFSVVLHKLEYALIMLNMLEYLCIYLKKQSSECVRILNVSSAIHSMRSMFKLLSSNWDRHIQYTVKYLRWNVLQKEQCLSAGALGHLEKISSKTQEKKVPQGNSWEF